MRPSLLALLIVAGLATAYLVLLLLLAVRSRTAPRLEARNGQLRPCARATNCVNTQDATRGILPLAVEGDAERAFATLVEVVQGLPRTRLLATTDGYLRAECASAVFGFRDDLEALLDRDAGVIHLRSASRVGIGDRGVNRARIEEVRRRFAQRTASGRVEATGLIPREGSIPMP